jgi:hypothetical protein
LLGLAGDVEAAAILEENLRKKSLSIKKGATYLI